MEDDENYDKFSENLVTLFAWLETKLIDLVIIVVPLKLDKRRKKKCGRSGFNHYDLIFCNAFCHSGFNSNQDTPRKKLCSR